MAYAYDMVDDMFGGQGNSNIFGGANNGQNSTDYSAQSPSSSPGYSFNLAGVNGPDENQKFSTEGDVNASPSPSGSTSTTHSANSGSDLGSFSPGANAASYAANVSNTAKPSALGQIQTDISNANSGLTQAAQDYITAQAQNNVKAIPNATIDEGVQSQNQRDLSQISSLLGQTPTSLKAALPAFQAGDTNIANLANLQTQTGIGQLLGQDQGANYIPNLSRFDASLLSQNPDFQNQVSGLQSQNQNLQNYKTDRTNYAQNTAQQSALDALSSAQGAATGHLNDLSSGITAAEAAAAKAANLTPEQQAGQATSILPGVQQTANQQATAAINAQYGQRAQQQLADAIAGNPANNSYINWTNYQPSDFVSSSQAQQYNTIAQLLGGKNTQTASGPLPAAYSTNPNGLSAAIIAAAQQARGAKDTSDTSDINSILAAADKAAQGYNSAGQSALQNYDPNLSAYGQQLLSSNPSFNPYSQSVSANYPGFLGGFNTTYEKNNPLTAPANATGPQTLTADQVAQLNNLQTDLGNQPNYAAGSLAGQSGPGNLYNSQDYQNQLLAALQALSGKQTTDPGAVGNAPGAVIPGNVTLPTDDPRPINRTSYTGPTLQAQPGDDNSIFANYTGGANISPTPYTSNFGINGTPAQNPFAKIAGLLAPGLNPSPNPFGVLNI